VAKWAQGTSDTYALGILAEMTGMDTPIVVLPFVNSALASRVAFRRSVETLRSEGVHVILGPGGFEPHRRAPGQAAPSPFRGVSRSTRPAAWSKRLPARAGVRRLAGCPG
jgi:hypothetical protein